MEKWYQTDTDGGSVANIDNSANIGNMSGIGFNIDNNNNIESNSNNDNENPNENPNDMSMIDVHEGDIEVSPGVVRRNSMILHIFLYSIYFVYLFCNYKKRTLSYTYVDYIVKQCFKKSLYNK